MEPDAVQDAYRRWGWRPVRSNRFLSGGGGISYGLSVFLIITQGGLLAYCLVWIASGNTGKTDPGETLFPFLLTFPLFVLGWMFLKTAREIRYEHGVITNSIGKALVAGVPNAKRIIVDSLESRGLPYEKILKGGRRLTIADVTTEGSQIYAIEGGRLHMVAVDLNALGSGPRTNSAILVGPFRSDYLHDIQGLCRDVDEALEGSGIETYPMDTYIEFYVQRFRWSRNPPFWFSH